MHTRAITPSIGVTIGQQMRLFHAFVTTAPAVLDAPSTVTHYLATLSDVSGLAADPSALDTNRTSTPARLVLVDSTELDWQRARYREGHCRLPRFGHWAGLATRDPRDKKDFTQARFGRCRMWPDQARQIGNLGLKVCATPFGSRRCSQRTKPSTNASRPFPRRISRKT
jgi:hypothetical protein